MMPCFDKKLEASRLDFVSDGTPDVDLVLGSTEVLGLIESNRECFDKRQGLPEGAAALIGKCGLASSLRLPYRYLVFVSL